MSGTLKMVLESEYEGEVKQRVTVEEFCTDETEQVMKNFGLAEAVMRGFKDLAEAGGYNAAITQDVRRNER